jgi:hypothetical protein
VSKYIIAGNQSWSHGLTPFLKTFGLLGLCAAAIVHDYVREGFSFPAASVIVFSMILGALSRRRAWPWGLVCGALAAAGSMAWRYWSRTPVDPISPLLALLPGVAAALTGAWLRKLVEKLKQAEAYSEV